MEKKLKLVKKNWNPFFHKREDKKKIIEKMKAIKAQIQRRRAKDRIQNADLGVHVDALHPNP